MKQIFCLLLVASLFSCKKDPAIKPADAVPAKKLEQVAYGSDPAQVMDIYLPSGRSVDSTKLIVMIHGGAWAGGDKSDFTAHILKIQQLFPGYAVANMNYRLATTSGNYFPTQENDVKAALNFLMQKKNEYLFNEKIVLLGASAGAHLATLHAYKNAPPVKAVVDFFGPTDLVEVYNTAPDPITKAGVQLLLGGTPASNPQNYYNSSPVNFITTQSAPTIIFHGSIDDVVPVSQSIALRNALAAHGVPHQLEIYPGMGHDSWPDAVMNDALNKARLFILTHVQ